jgi:hypothetical protein
MARELNAAGHDVIALSRNANIPNGLRDITAATSSRMLRYGFGP